MLSIACREYSTLAGRLNRLSSPGPALTFDHLDETSPLLPDRLRPGLLGLLQPDLSGIWERTLRFNFGGDTVSSAVVTGSFLLGLGIGALLFGSWRSRPGRVLGFIEIGVGSFALISYGYLTSLAPFLSRLADSSIADASGLRWGVLAGCVLFILPPTILMGGTLPVFFNWFIPSDAFRSSRVGLVYGVNTLGAAVGILIAPHLLLNHLSIPRSLLIVGAATSLSGFSCSGSTGAGSATPARCWRALRRWQPRRLPFHEDCCWRWPACRDSSSCRSR